MKIDQPMENRAITPAGRFAAFGLLLLILFAGVIPVVLDLRGVPQGRDPDAQHPPKISSWPTWPTDLSEIRAARSTPEIAESYTQVAGFANRSAYAMRALEQTITDARAGRASPSMVYHAARAEAAAAEDERDALMGYVVPPALRSNQPLQSMLRLAQLAALAKIHTMDVLDAGASDRAPWTSSEYSKSLYVVRTTTYRALRAARSL